MSTGTGATQGFKRVRIKLAEEATGGNRDVRFDDIVSHDENDAILTKLLKETKLDQWRTNQGEGEKIGKQLYFILNGARDKLKFILDEAYEKREPISLYIETGPVFSVLPFELIHDGGRFLLLDDGKHLVRLVSNRGWHEKSSNIEKRPLKMVFMASSPTDLEADSVLNFEVEEDHVVKATEEYQVDVKFEDSGSVKGLNDTIREFGGCDVVHITGHADVDNELGPVFLLENEVGYEDPVIPDRLWEALKDHPPRMLFLSGCSTGKGYGDGSTESFAYQMVEKGIPVVLGWGLPVSDAGAIVFTMELYRSLAVGHGINEAVQTARNEIANRYKYHPWPLLRIFTDGTPLTPIIDKGQRLRYHTARAATVEYLGGAGVKVLTEGFIGRRREVQRGISAINGKEGKYGAIIHGTAGNGKSCLAGKLIVRFKHRNNSGSDSTGKELIAIHGIIRQVDIVSELFKLFDRKGNEKALNILKSDAEYEDKIKALFRGPLNEVPTIIYFDDFEQNLEFDGNGHVLKPEPLEAVMPLLTAVDWADHNTVILITSRYPFKLVEDGKDLPAAKLEHIPLTAFKDADLKKKVTGLTNEHKTLYLKYGGGNPWLFESFDKLTEDEKGYDLAALEAAIKGKVEEFINTYLNDKIAKAAGGEFEGFLRRAAVYRIPVRADAFKDFGGPKHLERGVALTLLEQEMMGDGKSFYWVTPVIRQRQWDKLGGDEKLRMHRVAFGWFDGEIGSSKGLQPKLLEEAVYHGLESGNVKGACKYAVKLGNYLNKLVRYRGKLSLYGMVEDKITEYVINEAIAEKDEYVATLLNNYGNTLREMGHPKQGIGFMEKALYIDLRVLGDKHPDIASFYNNIGEAWKALGEYKKAIGFYQKALDIDLQVLGDKHPHVAIRYNNIGTAWNSIGQFEEAIDFCQKALDIDLQALGDKHPHVARDFNNIGSAWNSIGQYEKAIDFYQKALDIDLPAYGDKHPHVATDFNNIGEALSSLGQFEKAIGFIQKALNIYTATFGNTHPRTQNTKKNLENVRRKLDSQ